MRLFAVNDEERLINKLRRGENRAMRDFYTLYSGALSAVCSRYICNPDDLKDVFQDCFINIITHINQFEYKGVGSLKAWATRIAVNQSLMYLRAKKRQYQIISEENIADELEVDDPNIERIPSDVLQKMIKELSEGYRTVFNLYVFEEKSHKEIACMLGIKEASSASQLHRAKNILARKINEYNNKQR